MELVRLLQGLPERNWDILIIGGAPGAGKSSVSYRVAQHFGVGMIEVDDLFVAIQQLTTPEQQPELHFWDTHPDPGSLSAEAIIEQGLRLRQVLQAALEAVVANHIESARPAVIEGDFILPALAAMEKYGDFPANSRVRAIFIDESDETQLLENFRRREPDEGSQWLRARVSWLYGEWIKSEADRLGLVILPSRPWETTFERLLEAVK